MNLIPEIPWSRTITGLSRGFIQRRLVPMSLYKFARRFSRFECATRDPENIRPLVAG